jgi:hypothetical protein
MAGKPVTSGDGATPQAVNIRRPENEEAVSLGFPLRLTASLKWAQQGLNLRPLPCEGSALPLSYTPLLCVAAASASAATNAGVNAIRPRGCQRNFDYSESSFSSNSRRRRLSPESCLPRDLNSLLGAKWKAFISSS